MAKKAYDGNEKNLRSVRFEEIRSILKERPISTQEELLAELKERGFYVTQGTVSRDIRDLNIEKARDERGRLRYMIGEATEAEMLSVQFLSLFKTSAVRVDQVLNQVVIRCIPGMASAVCASVDAKQPEGILGTIAGEDTILVIADSENSAVRFAEALKDLI